MGLLLPLTWRFGDRSGWGAWHPPTPSWVPLVLETVQVQFLDKVPVPVLCYDTCPWCSRQCRRSSQLHLGSPPWCRSLSFWMVYHRCHYYCCDLVLFVGRLLWLCGPFVLRGCLRRGIVWWWMFPGGAYDSVWDSVLPMTGIFLYFQFQWTLGVLHAEWLVPQQRRCLPRQLFSRFKLQDKCRCEKWEVFLYGVLAIKVDRDSVECCPGVCLRLGFHPTWQRITHHLCVVLAF